MVSARIGRRVLAYQRLDQPGAEVAVVTLGECGGLAEGTTVCAGDAPFAWRWRVAWDEAWRAREAMVERLDSEAAIALTADGRGGWIDGAGARVAVFEGCIDLDLAATPFAATLAIHRLGLAVGESREIIAACLAAPDPLPRAVAQRYSRPAEDLWRAEAIFRGAAVELRLGADGFVAEYGQVFRRGGAR